MPLHSFIFLITERIFLKYIKIIFCRMYDRNQGTSPVDPYYGGGIPPGPPTHVDPYHSYDPYQKFHTNQSRDPEYPVSTSQNPSSRFRLFFLLCLNKYIHFTVIMMFIQIIAVIHMQQQVDKHQYFGMI